TGTEGKRTGNDRGARASGCWGSPNAKACGPLTTLLSGLDAFLRDCDPLRARQLLGARLPALRRPLLRYRRHRIGIVLAFSDRLLADEPCQFHHIARTFRRLCHVAKIARYGLLPKFKLYQCHRRGAAVSSDLGAPLVVVARVIAKRA